MKKEPKKENAMAKQPKKETAGAASRKRNAKPEAKKGVDIKFLRAPMVYGLAYFPGEIVKNYDKKQAEELIESGFAVKI